MDQPIVSEDTISKKSEAKGLQKMLGIILGIFMIFIVLVSSFESLLYSPSFFLAQNKNYNIVGEMKLYNVDNYIRFYTVTMDYLRGKNDTDFTLYIDGEHVPMFSQTELDRLEQFKSTLLLFSILRWVAVALSVGILVYVLATAQRTGLRRVGFSSLLTVLALIVLSSLTLFLQKDNLPAVLQQAEGFFFGSSITFTPDMILYHAMGTRYASDFAFGWAKLSGAFSLAAVFVSYTLARLSISSVKNDDDGDDYLYQ